MEPQLLGIRKKTPRSDWRETKFWSLEPHLPNSLQFPSKNLVRSLCTFTEIFPFQSKQVSFSTAYSSGRPTLCVNVIRVCSAGLSSPLCNIKNGCWNSSYIWTLEGMNIYYTDLYSKSRKKVDKSTQKKSETFVRCLEKPSEQLKTPNFAKTIQNNAPPPKKNNMFAPKKTGPWIGWMDKTSPSNLPKLCQPPNFRPENRDLVGGFNPPL